MSILGPALRSFERLPFGIFFFSLLVAGCSESIENVIYEPPVVVGDSTLPDGFVAANRPANPAMGFPTPCPLGVVPEGMKNPVVVSGGPPPDGIPSIDKPKFGSVRDVDPQMVDFERLAVVELGGIVRGFPIKVLIHHEVVNVCWALPGGGEAYSLVTYCPLVDAALHFLPDGGCLPAVSKKRLGYGVGGAIYNGNLIVFERETDSLFVQMYGGGISKTCFEIEPVLFDMTWSGFRRLFPEGQVLTEDTGYPEYKPLYDVFDHPYADYWRSNDVCISTWCFPLTHRDNRLLNKTPVYGVATPGGTKAYPLYSMTDEAINDRIGDIRVVVWNDRSLSSTAAFEPVARGNLLTFSYVGREKLGLPLYKDAETGSIWTFDGIAVSGPLEGERLPHAVGYRSFWFAWVAFFPETLLFTAGS